MGGLSSFFFFCLTVGIIINNVQARLSAESIIAGTESRPHEFPYMISLQSNGSHFCGGGIINEQFILTAAHCFIDEEDNFRDGEFEVVAGTNNLKEDSDTTVKVGVAAVYSSALYNGGSKNHVGDIAVLKLKEKLNLDENSGLGKLILPPNTKDGLNDSNSFAEQEATIAGFGWDEVQFKIDFWGNLGLFNVATVGSSTGKLMKAKAKIVSSDICKTIVSHPIEDSQLCASIAEHEKDVPQGVCDGDSGSPLVQNGMAIGLVSSSGMDCNDSERPGTYTRVSAYVELIENVMKGTITDANGIGLASNSGLDMMPITARVFR